MDSSLYEQFAAIESVHWWFQGRRRIVGDVLTRFLHGKDRSGDRSKPSETNAGRRILDIGCGTGEMLDMLTKFGDVWGMDASPEAVDLCRRRLASRIDVTVGRIPEDLPQVGGYDIVTAFDLLEHLDDDEQALAEIYRLLRPGGLLVCTVPAYMVLWSPHDELAHHRRRYTRRDLVRRVRGCGFEVKRSSYFNTWLLPVVATVRVVKRGRSSRGAKPFESSASDLAMPHPLVNRLLTTVLASERFVMRLAPLPAGVSILTVATKPNTKTSVPVRTG